MKDDRPSIPEVSPSPPFDITRSSHVRLTVRDLAASVHFYTEVLGMVVSDLDGDFAYLRGIEEACHHSLVLVRSDEAPSCECVGMRVRSEGDLIRAKGHFESLGGEARFIERPHQGPTLLTSFGPGFPPVELCAWMPILPRLLNNFVAQKGGRALRLDHYQCVIPDVNVGAARFMALGFRPSKYTTDVDSGKLLSIFLHRKNNPHDIVLAQGAGPRLHHVAFIVSDLQAMLRACDIAANLGFGRNVEHGPGRHGPPNGIFTYFRDPDGHRIEFGLPPMQYMDPEEVPNAWDSTQGVSLVPWGSGPPQRWREEMTQFAGIEPAGGTLARWTSLAQTAGAAD
ncbi:MULTISPECIES: VOC family protein [unclassified Sinorhizobium]|uniref:VOC family protein n=1 Tax=unclassified Sinorhizobium TaxID=2613772 RepID=UPI0035267651